MSLKFEYNSEIGKYLVKQYSDGIFCISFYLDIDEIKEIVESFKSEVGF